MASVAQQAIRGAAWTMVLNMAGRGIGLVGTLIITRYLAPEEIGEVQVAVVLITTANYFSLFGLGQYIASRPDEGREAAFHATVMALGFGAIAIGATVLMRDWLGPRFDAPAATGYLPGMALSMALDRLAFIPTRVLVRDMRFRSVALVRTAGEMVFPFVAVGLALDGRGGEALVIANVVRSLVRTGATLAIVNWRTWAWPCRLSWKKTREILSFGLPNGVASMAGFAAGYWDNLLMARLFGAGELGHYQLAYNLSTLPSTQVGEHVGDVLLPSFARIPMERRGPALVRAVRLLALVMFPLSFGLAVMAPTIVAAVLSPAWEPVGSRVTILAVLSAVYPLGFAVHSYMNAVNRPRLVMWLSIARIFALLGAMWLLGHLGGPLWACVGVGVGFGGYTVAGLVMAARIGGVSPSAVLLGLLPALLACGPMVAMVLGVRVGLRALGFHAPLVLVSAEFLAGAVSFVGAALVIAPTLSREFVQVISTTLLGRRRPTVTAPAVAAGGIR